MPLNENGETPSPPAAEVLKKVRRLEIVARRRVDELFAGRYNSTFKGRGMEFAEVREYLPGDDVRSIDWNVTARMGHPFIKKFVEERELTVLFLVDASLSQRFGTTGQWKSELAAEVTAVLAFAALRGGDKAGLALFSRDVEKFIPPRKTRAHALRIIREVLTHRPSGRGTSIGGALTSLNRLQRRRAVIFLVSDFLDQDFDRALGTTARRHEVIAVPISDSWERDLPAGPRLLLEDAETGELALVNAGQEAFRAEYRARNGERARDLLHTFRRNGVDTVPLRTGLPYTEPFLRFFAERAKRWR
jgi:uncharacterized protein (DUF58 family)